VNAPGGESALAAQLRETAVAPKRPACVTRGLSFGERLAALNEILPLAEAFGSPRPSREPIVHGKLLF
jgi:hypothetical protein